MDDNRLEQRVAVLEALHRLQTAIDARDWEAIRGTFLPDATGYGSKGADAIVATMQAHFGGCGPTQHLLGNEFVECTGDGAIVHAAARVYHVGAGSKHGSFFECMGDYTDHWLATPDGWRLRRRHFEMRIMHGDFGVLKPS